MISRRKKDFDRQSVLIQPLAANTDGADLTPLECKYVVTLLRCSSHGNSCCSPETADERGSRFFWQQDIPAQKSLDRIHSLTDHCSTSIV